MQADFLLRFFIFSPLFHILCLSVCLSPWFAAARNYPPTPYPTPPLVSFFPRGKLFGSPSAYSIDFCVRAPDFPFVQGGLCTSYFFLIFKKIINVSFFFRATRNVKEENKTALTHADIANRQDQNTRIKTIQRLPSCSIRRKRQSLVLRARCTKRNPEQTSQKPTAVNEHTQ